MTKEDEIKKLVNDLMPLLDLGGKKYLIGLLKGIKEARLHQISTSESVREPSCEYPYQEKNKPS